VKKVYTVLQQIYSGNGAPYFIRIDQVVYRDITKKHYGIFFLDTVENRPYNHFKSRPSHATDKSQHLRKVMSDYEYSGSYIISSKI